MSDPDKEGYRVLTFEVNGILRELKVLDKTLEVLEDRKLKADKNNPCHLGSTIPGTVETVLVKEGDEVKVSNLTFRVMETPGHTPGGVTLICGDALFTGDTLFAGSCGRTDFAGGSMEVELQSLAKIAALPGDYEVYPGHMDCSTLETERRFNPYLTALQNRGQ